MTDRLATLKKNIPPELDAVLITSGVNRRYYLRFKSSAGIILVTRDQSYFVIDTRYFEAACDTVKNCEVILGKKQYEQLDELMKKHGVKSVGIESAFVTLNEFAKLKSKFPDVTICEDERVSKLISKQRSMKSDDEVANIAAAQAVADKTFAHILTVIKPGMSEIEIAIELEQFSRRAGSEEPAFSFIVAAGANSARPHAVPSDYKVKSGDFITMDFGCTVNGYRSDMTRTVGVGTVSDKQREVYNTVLKAQLAGIAAVKAGVSCFDVDKAARDVIDATVYKGLFGHGLGHSLGLDIHEDPRFNTECFDKLNAGVVMSVEPGIYIPGEFGVRIEDIVVSTASGCDNLAKAPKDLIIV